MKRILFLFILIIPFIVYAEDSCNPDSVKIESIKLDSKSDNVIEKEAASIDGNSLNVNLSVSNKGDNARYELVLNNTSDVDYEINDLNLDSEYVGYSIISEDGSNIVKAGASKKVYLVVKYENEIPDEKINSDGLFVENKNFVVDLSNKEVSSIVKAIEENPYTSTGIILVVVAIVSGLVILSIKKVKVRKYMVLVIPVLVLIPYTVYAVCKCELKVNSKVEVNTNYTGVIYRTDPGFLRKGSRLKPHEEEIWCRVENGINSCKDSYDSLNYIGTTKEECEYDLENPRECELTKVVVGTDDYQTSSDDLENSVYLKHEVDDGIVTKTYACYKDEEKREICVQYDDDNFDVAEEARDEIYSFFEENYEADNDNNVDVCYYLNSRTSGGVRVFRCLRQGIELYGEHYAEKHDSYQFRQSIHDGILECNINYVGSYCKFLIR